MHSLPYYYYSKTILMHLGENLGGFVSGILLNTHLTSNNNLLLLVFLVFFLIIFKGIIFKGSEYHLTSMAT